MDSEKLLFYEAVLQQLHDDGLEDAATSLKQQLNVEPNGLLRKDHLFDLFRKTAYLSSRTVAGASGDDPESAQHERDVRMHQILNEVNADHIPLDPLYKLAGFATFCDFPTYRPCRCIAESSDGSLLATGGAGGALHVIPTVDADHDTLRRKPNWQTTTRLQGHQEQIEALDFHPRRNIIASGSAGCNIMIHDVNVANGFVQCAPDIQKLTDSFPIRCLRFHPCGDFLFAGTSNSILRLFDITTRSCFTSSHTSRQHQSGGINSCDVLHSGGLVFTAGGDGALLMWDGKTLEVMHALEDIHGGAAVMSVRCDKYGRYITSSGQDGSTKVTDLRMMRELASLGRVGRGTVRTVSNFMCNTRYVTTFSALQNGRRISNEVLVYCVDTGSQEADISGIFGRSHVTGVLASQHDMALYLLTEDSNCKVVTFFDPSA